MKLTPRIVIVGPQGSGKGTQAGLLSRRLHIPHISAGEELRKEMAAKTPLGRKIAASINSGKLQPDPILLKVMSKRLAAPDCRGGWISDGFPRRVNQARPFAKIGKPNLIIHLQLDDHAAIRRLSGRRVCPHGHIYHLHHDPPRRRRGYCDRDGLKLRLREDDTPQAIRRRLRLYHRESAPVIGWYHGRVPIVHVDAHPGISQVYRGILRGLKKYPWLSSPAKRK